ncbi:MAG: ROK family protein [Spirochaetes bacterium]|nr:ROK family protein [Spirochaetota bacterium]
MKEKSKTLRSTDIREHNEKVILHLLYLHQILSQSEACLKSGLKPPTVFRIFSALEKKGLIQIMKGNTSQEKGNSDKKGRKPVYYTLNARHFYSIGVDFWSKQATIVITDFTGHALFHKVTDLPQGYTASQVLNFLSQLIHNSIKGAKISEKKILGIGICAPGRVNIEQGLVVSYTRIKDMKNFEIAKLLKQEFGTPIYVHNNCSIIGLSEYYKLKNTINGSVLTILIRSGVGGALINNGQVFIAQDNTTLEFGHMSIDWQGKSCECGGTGCLETYLSEDAFLNDFKSLLKVNSIEEIDENSNFDSPETIDIIEQKAQILFVGIRNLFKIFNCTTFLVISRSKKLSQILVQRTMKLIEEQMSQPIEIIPLRYDPVTVGTEAAKLVLNQYFLI